jgi:hypothetical protein
MTARVDHLVVAAASLAQGVAWCEATLGVTPGAGGEHPLMGTHNRLLRIATVDYPRAYFEIIAIQPGVQPQRAAPAGSTSTTRRCATACSAAGRACCTSSPTCRRLTLAVRALAERGLDRGEALSASRMTARGLLEWQITVRPDGQRLLGGALPTLIEWGATHPASAMPESGVTLQSLCACQPDPAPLAAAYDAIALQAVTVKTGAANLVAVLNTPRGRVRLESGGL